MAKVDPSDCCNKLQDVMIPTQIKIQESGLGEISKKLVQLGHVLPCASDILSAHLHASTSYVYMENITSLDGESSGAFGKFMAGADFVTNFHLPSLRNCMSFSSKSG